MKTFNATNGMFNYEVVIRKCELNGIQFKLRSVSPTSALYYSDADFKEQMFLDFGYYEAKGLSQSGFSTEQINEMFNNFK
jgi:hypothetical protein